MKNLIMVFGLSTIITNAQAFVESPKNVPNTEIQKIRNELIANLSDSENIKAAGITI